MPAIREHDDLCSSLDDDDDMPSLVDNPYSSMSFTFTTHMTPVSYSNDATPGIGSYELPPPPPDPSAMFIMSPPTSPFFTPARPASISKRRDASHIPRPPNAFILFRSSFIKAQHIPDKIEGNHSSLSKIIGMYWKTLPIEERKVWEAKAVVAQAEHRQKYPDWRFRPGNIVGKIKDSPRKRGNKKGRGEAEEEEKIRQKRCAKIARLLEEGMTGTTLENAVREYDRKAGSTADDINTERSSPIARSPTQPHARKSRRKDLGANIVIEPKECESTGAGNKTRERPRARTLDPSSPSVRLKVPVIDGFKRSSSVPAIIGRASSPESLFTPTSHPQIMSPASPYGLYSHNKGIPVSPLSFTSPEALPMSQRNTHVLPTESMFLLPALDTDLVDYGSPASSTMDYIHTPVLTPGAIAEDPWQIPLDILVDDLGNQPVPTLSTYSSLTGWAGDEPRYFELGSPVSAEEAGKHSWGSNDEQSIDGWNGLQYAPHDLFYSGGGILYTKCAVTA